MILPSDEEVFTKHLLNFSFPGESVHLEKIPESSTREPDIKVPSKKLIIEVKGLHNQKDNQKSSNWHKATGRLKDKLEGYEWTGEFHLSGDFFKVSRQSDILDQAAKELAEFLPQVTETPAKINLANKFRFTIGRCSNEGKAVYFSASEFSYGSPNTAAIEEQVRTSFEKAESQIQSFRERNPDYTKGWLLLVVQYFKLWNDRSILINSCKNIDTQIDRVWAFNFDPSTGEAGGVYEVK